MTRVFTLLICLQLGLSGVNGAEVEVNGTKFTLPDGFSLELVAGPDLVPHPICADFDEQGRLYVADSSGSNENVKTQLEKKPHRIVRLEDTNGDGVFDNRVVFADRMMFPEGTLWHDGSLYVAAPPEIWKLTDTDDDGIADKREVWFDAKTLTGCANDLHGPYLGPDGWIYWCKGAFAEQTYERAGRKPFVTKAAHIFRRRPEGGEVEAVMTGGMDNPVEVAFSRGGERFFTTTFLQHPRDGKRDGIIHAVYGGVYGKNHGVLDGHPRTGELMPVLSHHGASAPCGLMRLGTGHFGGDYRDSLLCCRFNMHKVSRHILKQEGGSYVSRDVDFLSSDDLNFHPTDVIEEENGSVLVIDTGGWYKLCCPTSQLYKPDVPGAIYRVRSNRRTWTPFKRDPNVTWRDMGTHQLIELLAHYPTIHKQAIGELVRRGTAVIDDLRNVGLKSGSTEIRLQTVWALCRMKDASARAGIRDALLDSDATVRQAAAHSVSVWKDRDAIPNLIELLRDKSLHNRRVACEALGRIGDKSVVPALLAAAETADDRVSTHSVIYALIEIAEPQETKRGLFAANPRMRKAALIALDQMEGGTLDSGDVVPLLSSGDALLRDAAWWLAERHPEWAADLRDWFTVALRDDPAGLASRLAGFAHDSSIQIVMADTLANDDASDGAKLEVLKAMAESRIGTLPDAWAAQLRTALDHKSSALVEQAVGTLNALADAKLGNEITTGLLSVTSDDQRPAELRIEALATAGRVRAKAKAGKVELDEQQLQFVCANLTDDQPVRIRALAADVLTSALLTDQQRRVAAAAMRSAGPMELRRMLVVFDGPKDRETGLRLVSALDVNPSAGSLDPEQLRKIFVKYPDDVVKAGTPLLNRIAKQNEEKLKRMDDVLALMEKADERRGQKLFHSTKAACIACHQMGYLGGNIGPSLNRIGNIRRERDLLESLMFPSASFVRSYEPVTVITTDGRVHNGLVRDETTSELILALDARKIERIAKSEIGERFPGKISVMPAGLDRQFSNQALADLIRFLKVSR